MQIISMGLPALLLVTAAAQPTPVTVTTLDGAERKGEFQELSATALMLAQDGQSVQLPVGELLQIGFEDSNRDAPSIDGLAQVALAGGSVLTAKKIESAEDTLTLESPVLGSVALPMASVSAIRFNTESANLDNVWKELVAREFTNDVLVIRRQRQDNDVLDHLDGVLGQIDEDSVTFLISGDSIVVPKTKLFGVIYFRRDKELPEPLCRIELGADTLQVQSLSAADGKLQATLQDGVDVSADFSEVRAIDFSTAKIRYLSQIEPREVAYTPYFDVTWEYLRDRNIDGDLLRLGNQTFPRGLWIHSTTRLTYRLDREYRRLKATMGIDYLVAQKDLGDVYVTIRGDGNTLLEAAVRGSDAPQPIDLDVSGVRELEIVVDLIDDRDLDIADHLVLGDVRVIK